MKPRNCPVCGREEKYIEEPGDFGTVIGGEWVHKDDGSMECEVEIGDAETARLRAGIVEAVELLRTSLWKDREPDDQAAWAMVDRAASVLVLLVGEQSVAGDSSPTDDEFHLGRLGKSGDGSSWQLVSFDRNDDEVTVRWSKQ